MNRAEAAIALANRLVEHTPRRGNYPEDLVLFMDADVRARTSPQSEARARVALRRAVEEYAQPKHGFLAKEEARVVLNAAIDAYAQAVRDSL